MSNPTPSGHKTLFYIPTFNDFEMLPEIFHKLAALNVPLDILVIDDGSDVAFDARPYRDRIYYHKLPVNFGIGTSLSVAVQFACDHGYAAMIRLDADGQHPVEEIPKLLAAFSEPGVDVVAGDRMNHHQSGQRYDWLRWIVKKYYSLFLRRLTKKQVPFDVNTGFIGLSRRALQKLSGHLFEQYPEPYLFLLTYRKGLKIKSVPVEQEKRRHGKSTLHFMHAARMLYRFNIMLVNDLIRKIR